MLRIALAVCFMTMIPGPTAADEQSPPDAEWRPPTDSEIALNGAAMGAALGSCAGAFGASFGWWSEGKPLKMVGARSAAGALWSWSRRDGDGVQLRIHDR